MRAAEPGKPSQNLTAISEPQMPSASVVEEKEEPTAKSNEPDLHESATEEITKLFPKRSRSRASLLLHYVMKNMSLDGNQRVMYNDGSRGSHIVDLVRYFINTSAMHIDRPIDAIKFAMELKSKGVPEAAFSRHIGVTASKVQNLRGLAHKSEPSPRHNQRKRRSQSQTAATKHGNIHSKWVRL